MRPLYSHDKEEERGELILVDQKRVRRVSGKLLLSLYTSSFQISFSRKGLYIIWLSVLAPPADIFLGFLV